MRLAKWLFFCHLAALVLTLCGLLLITPYAELWGSSPGSIATWQWLLRFAAVLQIGFGAAAMMLFSWLVVGSQKTLVFFGIFFLISFLLDVSLPGRTLLLKLFLADSSSSLTVSGLEISLLFLSWLYMGCASSLLAWKLVGRLGLRRQNFWSLTLGTYFLLAWATILRLTLVNVPLSVPASRIYNSTLGLPAPRVFAWIIGGLLLLGLIQLFWGRGADAMRLAISLPFWIYTANIGFVMILSFSLGLWFPLFLATFFVLAPETLAIYPREESSTLPPWIYALPSQGMWLAMRLGALLLFRRQVKLNVQGMEHMPRSGPVLIAARHFHYFYDGYALIRLIPRRIHIMVALDWLQAQGLRLLIEVCCGLADWPVVLRGGEMKKHAVQRPWAYQQGEGRRYLRQVIHSAVRLLRAGEVVVIFPEGYPNIDPHPTPKPDLETFLPFQDGLITMAAQAQKDGRTRVAIVPTGLAYTRLRGKKWQVDVRMGTALYLENFANRQQALHAIEEQTRALSSTLPPPLLLETPRPEDNERP